MEKNNNDLFELMTKMYGEIQEMKGEFNNRFDKVEKEVTKTNVTIENDIKPRIEALFDGYKQNTESINQVSDKVDELQSDLNRLTIKTLRTETNIIDINKILRNQ
ncbi:hypothetical protein [Clostridium neonatale]|uniref:Uncharacterized protein n=1 Tax=Clostridium neonatale TaxID=137838 RepID=A0AAD1YDQ7_9CLOT|nr:hypothetical protein [Clostridium neonatale]DAF76125.1 MAG TPA: hypothetical protein [Caudoviricetes sp.]CAI3207762.1 conserved hypothetical protein [Clostridium neonatale]CAI3210112.1 conserved hypothetical protein [Clostridium neonatale]CAI3215570.1 conserved hypothetical protein [Clostridium neonatale]CAI3224950.1 conserved hypothetical protein [Clostridium neonatale]